MWQNCKNSQAVHLSLVGCVILRRAEPTSEHALLGEQYDQHILPVSWFGGIYPLVIMSVSTPDKAVWKVVVCEREQTGQWQKPGDHCTACVISPSRWLSHRQQVWSAQKISKCPSKRQWGGCSHRRIPGG